MRLVSANIAAPFYRALYDLVVVTLGPVHVLREELDGLDGIRYAAVFGSWAARACGEDGQAPADIDLLVVGTPDRDDVHEAASRATRRLGRTVSVLVVLPERWESNDDGFLNELRARPMVAVSGSRSDLPEGHGQ